MSERPTEALREAAHAFADAKVRYQLSLISCSDCNMILGGFQNECDAIDATLAAKDRRIEELERAIRKAIPECEGGVGFDAAKFFLRPVIGLDDYEEVPEEPHNGK